MERKTTPTVHAMADKQDGIDQHVPQLRIGAEFRGT